MHDDDNRQSGEGAEVAGHAYGYHMHNCDKYLGTCTFFSGPAEIMLKGKAHVVEKGKHMSSLAR